MSQIEKLPISVKLELLKIRSDWLISNLRKPISSVTLLDYNYKAVLLEKIT